MSMFRKYKIDISLIVIIVLGIIYVSFPSINNSGDSIAYAIDIREGKMLFNPHHLMYSILGYMPTRLFNIYNTLAFMCGMNAIFTILCLVVLRLILLQFTTKTTAAWLLLFVGSCFGLMRFAIDNETYIVPIFFSLCASFAALKHKNAFIVSLLGAIACLFHQIHFFWWFGILVFIIFSGVNINRLKNFVLYAAGAMIVPITYLLVFYFTNDHDCSNIIEFVFRDYIKIDDVEFTVKGISLLLTPINFIRTFIQVHGYIYPLIANYPFFAIGGILSIMFFILALFNSRKSIQKKSGNHFSKIFYRCHLFIFVLQLIFAFISDGNAEFMVMLPSLLVIVLTAKYNIKDKFIAYAALSIFCWNITFGLIPSHFFILTSDIPMANYIARNPDQNYYLTEKIRIKNYLDYYYPNINTNLLTYRKQADSLDAIVNRGETALTNVVATSASMSRGSILENTKEENGLEDYNLRQTDSINYDLGVLYITRISRKYE